MQHRFYRIRAAIRAQKNGGLVAVEHEGLAARVVILPCAVELLDSRPGMPSVHPFILSAELEARQLGLFLNVVDRFYQLINVDSVETSLNFRSHGVPSPLYILDMCLDSFPV
jgi:hypothetical protein